MRFQSLKGFRDFYPEDMAARRIVFDKILDTVKRYGFREVDAPSVESLDLFRIKSGDEILGQTFNFKDKGDRDITLIPELTPTVARMVVDREKTLRRPIKWYSMPKLWRYEEPQSGRLREFYQLNVDIFGVSGPEADSEVIASGIDIMLSLGLEGEFVFKISDRRLMQGVLEALNVQNAPAIFSAIDKRGKVSHDEFKKMLYDAGMNDIQMGHLISILDTKGPLAEALPKLKPLLARNPLVMEGYENLEKILDLMKMYRMEYYCELDPSIIRGLAYYTGTVFECFDTKGELRAIFGGGRYDKIIGLFGGADMCAVGFGMGDAVLEILMRRANVWPHEKIMTDYYVLTTSPDYREVGIFLAQSLREKDCVVETDMLGRNFSNQMKYANSIGAKKVLILGEKEMAGGKVSIKDMTTGEQETKEIITFLESL
ncbi:histidine--tRNA ligase [Methanocella sp. CWC-04]|uniref:Histidine--tRNA ligase n=1 Tax=Methanooceanicella nereidis TaxID=2052831 RepID=A0AAP2RDB0_9EURY|nr:histidine--tRNA ligase [Methanocella sp. CWC-04]MCD1295486.1 histidine--tRNA ligase [Methanocella sp. CWC-04]